MKFILTLLLCVFSMAAFADDGFSVFAAGGTKQNGTNYVIVPTQTTLTRPQPVVTYISATGTNAASVLNFWTSTNVVTATVTNNGATLVVTSTNNFVPGQLVVIQHSGAGPLLPRWQYERGTVASVANTNQIVLTVAPLNTLHVGDKVYAQTLMSSIPVGATTVTLTGPGIVAGARGIPMLIDEGGGSTNMTINAVNVQFIQ